MNRFQNTLKALQDCNENLFENLENLDQEELTAREKLIKLCNKMSPRNTIELSEIQIMMLELASQGVNNHTIAEKMKLGTTTITNHFSATYRILGANNLAHAIMIAAQKGIIGEIK